MSVAEIYYRIMQQIRGQFEEKFRQKTEFSSKLVASSVKILDINVIENKPVPNSLSFFGTEFSFNNPEEINWQKDILSGGSFNPDFYRKINIRKDPNLSAKCVWEINRLQFLTGVCANYKTSGKEEDLILFMRIIRSWAIQNPYLIGINWYSNIEINLRLITWFLCWEILDADEMVLSNKEFKEFVGKEWLPLIKKHCVYSYENPSKYSSANNHLISEYAGLFIASSKWKFSESEKWFRYSRRGLEKEIIRQHSKKGVNKEEAAEYIQFVTDFFLLAFIIGEKINKSFSAKYKDRLYKIFCYIYDLLDCNGNFPKYGDEDDGKCYIIDFDNRFNNFKSLLTSGAILFNNSLFKSKGNGFDMKNQFLFGENAKSFLDSLPVSSKIENSRFYSKEGHFIFRKRENAEEIYMHFDSAPLGFLSIAAHGHADALSFILNVDGHPVFTDSGTFTYHTDPVWRSYFTGTLAHNTIRLNGKDQASSGGPTLWIRKYQTRVLDIDLNGNFEHVKATHDGYEKDGIQHIRDIVFFRDKNEYQILDTVIVNKETNVLVEIPFHIHPDLSVTPLKENNFIISNDKIRKTKLHIDGKLTPMIIKGQMNPEILGWYSDSFLKKEPANVIYCKTQIEFTTTFKFIIKIE